MGTCTPVRSHTQISHKAKSHISYYSDLAQRGVLADMHVNPMQGPNARNDAQRSSSARLQFPGAVPLD